MSYSTAKTPERSVIVDPRDTSGATDFIGGAVRDVTLVCDTSIYADGDVLSATAVITDFFPVVNGVGEIKAIRLADEDDQGIALDIFFLDASTSIGSANAAFSPSDAVSRDLLCHHRIATGDYLDLGGVRIATKTACGLFVKAKTDTKDLYIATVTRGGTPTYTASGLRLRLGVQFY